MACGGPSKEFAVIRSQAAYDEIMQLLKDKYQVDRPVAIGELGIYAKWQDEWDADADKFREQLAELFWHSDAASW